MSKRMVPEKVEEAAPAGPAPQRTRGLSLKPLVFVSHDSRDADLAEEFSNLLSDVSGGTLKSFRSSDRKGTAGIEFGAEWYKAIMTKLGDATDVVALLTQKSIDRPWILYEAGVAKGKLESVVFGIAIGVPLEKVSTGPFAQFQNCGDDDDSLTKLVPQLLQRNPEAAPREEAVRMQVKVFRDHVGKLIKDRAKAGEIQTEGQVGETAIAKMFEEVKVMVGELPEMLEGRLRKVTRRAGLRRIRHFDPMMLEEMLFHPDMADTPDARAAGWLMFISMFRDDMPWLYEVGLELYRALKSNDPEEIEGARARLERVAKIVIRGPWSPEMMGVDDEETFMMMRHLPEILSNVLGRLTLTGGEEPRNPLLRKRKPK